MIFCLSSQKRRNFMLFKEKNKVLFTQTNVMFCFLVLKTCLVSFSEIERKIEILLIKGSERDNEPHFFLENEQVSLSSKKNMIFILFAIASQKE